MLKGEIMKSASGVSPLNELLEVINHLIINHPLYKDDPMFDIVKKIKKGFYKGLLPKTVLLYTRVGSLSATTHASKIVDHVDDIFHIADIVYVLFLLTLTKMEQQNYQVKWRIEENTRDIIEAEFMHQVVELDFWQDRSSKTNSVGRLDYEKMERCQKSSSKNIKTSIMKNGSSDFFIPLLDIGRKSLATGICLIGDA